MNSYAGMIAATVIVVLLFTSAAVPQAVSGDEMDRRLNSATDHVQMANIYGKDSRVFVPQFQRPWNMIGQIRTDEKTICTAFLVNECTVATVGHCFRNKESTGSPYYTNPKFFPAGEAALPLQNIRAGDPALSESGASRRYR